jgi:hypothetical protein
MSVCSVANCGKPVKAKGKCSTHYDREKHGREATYFRSDNLRRAQITEGDIRQLELILSHLPAKKAGQP